MEVKKKKKSGGEPHGHQGRGSQGDNAIFSLKGAVAFSRDGREYFGAERVTECFLEVYLASWQVYLLWITIHTLYSRLGVWNYYSS